MSGVVLVVKILELAGFLGCGFELQPCDSGAVLARFDHFCQKPLV